MSIFLFLVHRILAKKKAASETREPLEGQDSTAGCSRFFLEIQPDDLHFHHAVAQPGQKAEEAADGRVFQVVIAQHVAPAGNGQPS